MTTYHNGYPFPPNEPEFFSIGQICFGLQVAIIAAFLIMVAWHFIKTRRISFRGWVLLALVGLIVGFWVAVIRWLLGRHG